MSPALTPLNVVAERIRPALDLLLDALRDALLDVTTDHETKGYDPADDPSLFNSQVRRAVCERIGPVKDNTKPTSNMSPVRLPLGPYDLRMVHAEDGTPPTPRTEKRKEYYSFNDQCTFALNVFAPDGLVVIEDGVTQVDENTLLLVWDSAGAHLTHAELHRPSLLHRGDSLGLLKPVAVEDDIEITPTGEGEEGTDVAGGAERP